MDGNGRFVAGHSLHPHQNIDRVREIAMEQHPYAVILCCSDSRVHPPLIFDQGLGDLFDIRVAGNIVDDAVLGSVEYAVEHLGSSLVMVLGHERCGAVQATIAHGGAGTHMAALVDAIQPALAQAEGLTGDPLSNVVRANVWLQAGILLAADPIIAKAVAEGRVKVVSAMYDLDTGVVAVI